MQALKSTAAICLALALSVPAAAADGPFAGEWLGSQYLFGNAPARTLALFDRQGTARSNGQAKARVLVIDEASSDGIRSNLMTLEFDCAARTMRAPLVGNYDPAGNLVNNFGASFTPVAVQPNSVFSLAYNYACFDEVLTLLPVAGDPQAAANQVFAAK